MQRLKEQYGENYQSQSTNATVLELYEFILAHEEVDSDYWHLDHGPQEVHQILKDYFIPFDWKALTEDLPHWTTRQLALLLYGLMNGYHDELNSALHSEQRTIRGAAYIDLATNKMKLLRPILEIGRARDATKNDIGLTIMEEMHFLEQHFELLVGKDAKYLAEMKKIIALTGETYVAGAYPDLHRKIMTTSP